MRKNGEIADKYYKYFLLMVFILTWAWSMWNPTNEKDWLVESTAVFVGAPIVYFLLIHYIRFSKLSLTLVTIFSVLHIIGAHYSYGSVPFGKSVGALFGSSDNMYDKVVHFSFGLLIVYPLRELFLRVAGLKGFWGYLVPFMGIATLGTLYEIYEWVTVLQYDPQTGYLFIGGSDPFDTTKDLSAAVLGSILTLSAVALFHYLRSKKVFVNTMKGSFFRDGLTFPREDKPIHERLENL